MKLYFGNMVTTVTTLMIVSLVGVVGYSVSNRSSNSNTNCKITAYARDMVLCNVRRSDAKDCSYGDRKNYTDVLGVFS